MIRSQLETQKMEVTEELLSLRLTIYQILSALNNLPFHHILFLGAYDTFSVGN